MNNQKRKGGSEVRLSDMIELLEYKILSNEETDEEMELYIDIKWNDVFRKKGLKSRLNNWYRKELKVNEYI